MTTVQPITAQSLPTLPIASAETPLSGTHAWLTENPHPGFAASVTAGYPWLLAGNLLNAQGERDCLSETGIRSRSWNMYSYVRNNPLKYIDPFGLCSQDASGGYRDSDDGGTLLFSGPCANGTIGDYNPSPTAPPVLNGPDPNNPAVEGNTVSAQTDSFDLWNFLGAGLDFIANSQLPLTGSFGVGLPPTGNSIGPQISVAYIPKTHRLCVSGGFYVTTPGSSFVNANIGILAVGALDKAEDVVSGFGVGGTLQKSLHGGYQVSSSSSGPLGGPSIGTLGISASAGYGGCFTIGGRRK